MTPPKAPAPNTAAEGVREDATEKAQKQGLQIAQPRDGDDHAEDEESRPHPPEGKEGREGRLQESREPYQERRPDHRDLYGF
jgi:hypothetical protein